MQRQPDPGALCEHDPANLSEEDRERNRIHRLPVTMASALNELERNQLFYRGYG